jgi:uncharacterized membrane protein
VIIWLVAMVKAWQGELFKLPIIGDIAERWVPQVLTDGHS